MSALTPQDMKLFVQAKKLLKESGKLKPGFYDILKKMKTLDPVKKAAMDDGIPAAAGSLHNYLTLDQWETLKKMVILGGIGSLAGGVGGSLFHQRDTHYDKKGNPYRKSRWLGGALAGGTLGAASGYLADRPDQRENLQNNLRLIKDRLLRGNQK
jgi:hypothetical protein